MVLVQQGRSQDYENFQDRYEPEAFNHHRTMGRAAVLSNESSGRRGRSIPPPTAIPTAYRYQFNYPYYRFKPRHYPLGAPSGYPFGFPLPGVYPFGSGPYGPAPWNYGGYTGNGFDRGVYGDRLQGFGGMNPYYMGQSSSNFGPVGARNWATPNLGWMGGQYVYGFGQYPVHTFGAMYGPTGGYGFFQGGGPTVIMGIEPQSGFDYIDKFGPESRSPYMGYGGMPVPRFGSGINSRYFGPAVYGTGNIVPTGGFYEGF
jgi:hypothetical protein